MTPEYWLKQSTETPLFDDILWSRPENKTNAGKLLLVGGNSHGFASVAEAYIVAQQSGAGVVRALLPDSLRKTVGAVLEATIFAPSTPSGSFASSSLDELLLESAWADGVLIAGDLGRNSETSMLLESFVQKYSGLLTLTKDAVDYFNHTPEMILKRPNTSLVLSLAQLQKLGTNVKFETPFLLSMGMLLLVQALHEFTLRYQVTIITKELDQIVVASNGNVSSTKLTKDLDIWRVQVASLASVFWIQNPSKTFEAMTTAIFSTK